VATTTGTKSVALIVDRIARVAIRTVVVSIAMPKIAAHKIAAHKIGDLRTGQRRIVGSRIEVRTGRHRRRTTVTLSNAVCPSLVVQIAVQSGRFRMSGTCPSGVPRLGLLSPLRLSNRRPIGRFQNGTWRLSGQIHQNEPLRPSLLNRS
jgi:hypothetical protein